MRRRAFPFAHKSYAKAPRCLCFHVSGLRRHHAGKSVGRWRLALRVHRVRQPAKSKVAEFVCKFKCLLPRATLNSDLHVDPLCCRMRESTTKENNFRCGCGRIDFFFVLAFSRLLTDVMISRSSAAEQSSFFFCSIAQKLL